jgi:DNA-binding response OmpR family regulator
VLTSEGYAVAYAHDGADAIARLSVDPPDAILLDLMMPGMNGRQFLSALRTELGLDLPVVVMTAVHGLGQRAISLGATDVVEKPFDVDELLNKVALAVFRARQTPAAAPEPEAPSAAIDDRVVVVVDRDIDELDRVDVALTRAGFMVVAVPDPAADLPRLVGALGACAVVVVVDGTEDAAEAIALALRGAASTTELPILAVTRGDNRADVAAAVESAAAVTLVRPGDDDLIHALRVVGRRARTSAA